MAGTFFEYFDGYVRVEFSRASYGDIYVDFTLHGDAIAQTPCDDHFEKGDPEINWREDAKLRTWTSSSVSWFFLELIRWLESIIGFVQECAFAWEGEGPEGELRWFRGNDGSGRLRVVWNKYDESRGVEREIRVNRAQLVRAFYESFRVFVESDRYDPLDYEELDAGETFALVLDGADLDALADHLATVPRDSAELLIDAMLDLAYDREAGYPRRASLATFTERAMRREMDESEEHMWVPAEWERWDFARRRRHVVEKIYMGGTCIGFGEKLRELRSPLIEKWLAQQAETASVGHEK